ncbi:MAG: RNA polymerase sigma factor [Actinomycetota bacterium]
MARNRSVARGGRLAPDDFVTFYRAWEPRLRAAVRLELDSSDDTSDLVQEVFVRACERWATVSSYESPESWLFLVAYNLIRSKWRRASTERRSLETYVRRDQQALPPDLDDEVARRDEVSRLLADLPDEVAAVLRLRFIEGCSVAETAALLDSPEATVKSRSRRGVAAGRRLLGVRMEAQDVKRQ